MPYCPRLGAAVVVAAAVATADALAPIGGRRHRYSHPLRGLRAAEKGRVAGPGQCEDGV